MSEAEFVRAIRAAFNSRGVAGELFDDDTARVDHLFPSHVTTDVVVEGVDFDRALYPLRYAGQRALCQNLSDLYAADCEAVGFLWAMSIPPGYTVDDVRAFADGAAALAAALGAPLLGGDLSRTDGPFQCAITAIGRAPGIALTRRGARVGQSVWLSRRVGASSAGLRILRDARAGDDEAGFDAWLAGITPAERRAVLAHVAPSPAHSYERLSDAAVCAIDVSDGFARDATRLADASEVGFDLDNLDEAIDVEAGATREDALFGGEDWALLFCVPDGLTPQGGIRVGTVVSERGLWRGGARIPSGGFDHFE